MSITEKFCLRWNYYQENVSAAFRALRKDSDFTDVTIACQDGHQFEAHKVVLVASSPFFKKLLKSNKHAHPLIYMKGMKSEYIWSILDFLYYGEANICQDNLDTFLNIAEELELKGLKREGWEGEKSPKKYIPRKLSHLRKMYHSYEYRATTCITRASC